MASAGRSGLASSCPEGKGLCPGRPLLEVQRAGAGVRSGVSGAHRHTGCRPAPDEIGAEVAEGGLVKRHLPEAVTRRGGHWGPGARPLRPRPLARTLAPIAKSGFRRPAQGWRSGCQGEGSRRQAILGPRTRPPPPSPARAARAPAAADCGLRAVGSRGCRPPRSPRSPRSAPGFRLRPCSLRRRAPVGRGLGRGRPGKGPGGVGPEAWAGP